MRPSRRSMRTSAAVCICISFAGAYQLAMARRLLQDNAPLSLENFIPPADVPLPSPSPSPPPVEQETSATKRAANDGPMPVIGASRSAAGTELTKLGIMNLYPIGSPSPPPQYYGFQPLAPSTFGKQPPPPTPPPPPFWDVIPTLFYCWRDPSNWSYAGSCTIRAGADFFTGIIGGIVDFFFGFLRGATG